MSTNAQNKARQVHFQNVTQVHSANDYLSGLSKDSLIIYSPTSLRHTNLNNDKVHMIDSRIFSRNIDFIEALSKTNRTYKNVVSLGGGTATDVAKYIAHKTKAMFTCIPSMLSTNAYATNKVALVVNGEKITLDAKMADKIILDASLLQLSPQQNLYGIADVLSIHTALNDWLLADKRGIESIDQNVFNQASKLLRDVTDFVSKTDTNHISYETPTLYSYIGESGYITNLYGTGRPESGSEHIFAKALEKRIEVPHGVSVSLGIIVMSILQDKYSDDIVSTINKIGTLKFIDEIGISRRVIEDVLMNIKPRDDRYSIINEVPMTKDKVSTVVDKLVQLTGVALR